MPSWPPLWPRRGWTGPSSCRWPPIPAKVSHINDAAAKVNEDYAQTGIFSFGGMHPDAPNWKEELSRVERLGLKGVKLHPIYQGVDLDDPRFLRILDRCGELGLVVLVHAGLDVGIPGKVHASPEMSLNALRQVGPVKLILAHMGAGGTGTRWSSCCPSPPSAWTPPSPWGT